MIKTGSYYEFTEEEKARIKRRKADAQKVRGAFDRWYKGLSLFPYTLWRSKCGDYGPFNGSHRSAEPVSTCTIIKYGLYAHSCNSLLDMFTLHDRVIEGMLGVLDARLSLCFKPGTYRIKAVRVVDYHDQVLAESYIQVIFVEDKDKLQQVKGDPITILTVTKNIVDFNDLPF